MFIANDERLGISTLAVFQLSDLPLLNFLGQLAVRCMQRTLCWSTAAEGLKTVTSVVWNQGFILRGVYTFASSGHLLGCCEFLLNVKATLRDLRTAVKKANLGYRGQHRFRFFYNGTLLGESVECRRLAISCLPMVLIVFSRKSSPVPPPNSLQIYSALQVPLVRKEGHISLS